MDLENLIKNHLSIYYDIKDDLDTQKIQVDINDLVQILSSYEFPIKIDFEFDKIQEAFKTAIGFTDYTEEEVYFLVYPDKILSVFIEHDMYQVGIVNIRVLHRTIVMEA